MSVDAVFDQLRRANPEPNPAALRQHLYQATNPAPVFVTRSNEMETQTIVKNPQPQRPRRLLPALAAGAVVLLAGIVFVIVSRDGGFFTSPTPLQIAESYMEARNAWDATRAGELLAPDAVLNDTPIIGRDELAAGFEVLRVYEFQFEPFECTESTAIVSCTYMMETNLQQIVGYPPVAGNFVFEIDDGQITRLTNNFSFTEFGPNAYDPFLTWLESAHPGAFDQLFRPQGAVSTPRLTPEALELARTYIAEYDQSFNG
jgi:hypothetical protein